ncbi:nucleotide-diphospho-sugar transferase [Chitinophaga qingshengii]|uniref:Nucleotide-diphospho-sugar transferase n=1 Tax=Chitinophaga qingshengii TaxID=1569794 RepID=A0ABR7TIR9_9BACT|nr:nucleotide-diphospho-sugar transferase [Chitinophaga qingshengii]MBC9929413.1 nucleotide-diphospho-sugar transferase [Chitinophaga qingshengii]
MIQTPVLILVFNRPDKARELMLQLRQQQPAILYVAADGPRADKPEEALQCERTRQAVLSAIDWPCAVKTLFRPHNLGCGKAVSSAISWFFENNEEGIILEDDCMPDPTFFTFCTAMLRHYRHDSAVMHINGSNFQFGRQRGDASYYYSRFAHIWGWASWRRAWQQYDFTLQRYRGFSTEGLGPALKHDMHAIATQRLDTWDVQWFLSVWFSRGWTITPNVSLIRNTGYGATSTHTLREPRWFKKIVYGELPAITHPYVRRIDEAADSYAATVMFSPSLWYTTVRRIIKGSPALFRLYENLVIRRKLFNRKITK